MRDGWVGGLRGGAGACRAEDSSCTAWDITKIMCLTCTDRSTMWQITKQASYQAGFASRVHKAKQENENENENGRTRMRMRRQQEI